MNKKNPNVTRERQEPLRKPPRLEGKVQNVGIKPKKKEKKKKE